MKGRCPQLKLVDTLYNKVGHTINHFWLEPCFDGVIVESADMRQFMLENTRKPDPGVHLVESGIDLSAFAMAEPRFEFSQRRPLRGRLCRPHVAGENPLGFVELAERLHQRLPDLRFRIFGEGPQAEAVRARIAGSSAAAAISYEGFVAHPSDALAQLHVLVVPSLLDGRPNVVMEANACGVPVIGAPIGGIPELIEPGRNGLVLRPSNHGEIAAALEAWLGAPDLYSALRASCRETAELRFDRNRMFDRYEAVFRSFLP